MEVIFHIGQQKTASTTLQACLSRIRPQLEAQGIRYSSAFGKEKATRLLDMIGRDKAWSEGDEGRLHLAFRKELSGPHRTLIVSNENLFSISPTRMERLRRAVLAGGADASVYAYVRRPTDHVVSNYQEKVDGFVALTLDEFIEHAISKGHYDYHGRFEAWAGVFGRDAVRVRLFDPARMTRGPVVDFLSWIGADPDALTLPDLGRMNPTSDALSVEAMRQMTLLYFRAPDLFDQRFPYEYRDALRTLGGGPRLGITRAQEGRLEAACAAGLRRFAEAFLPEPERDGLLAPAGGARAAPAVVPGAVLLRMIEALGQIAPRIPAGGLRDGADASGDADDLDRSVGALFSAHAGRGCGDRSPPGGAGADDVVPDIPLAALSAAAERVTERLRRGAYRFRLNEGSKPSTGKDAARQKKLRRKMKRASKRDRSVPGPHADR